MRTRRAARCALIGCALVATLAGAARADLGGFVIDRFHTDVEVLPDADLLVEERIEVRFLEPRRGLYRTIPVRYTDPKGYAYSLGFDLIEVLDESGSAHRTKVTNEGRYVNVRIGDPDRTISGPVVYRLRYRVERALGHFPEYDEVYWNAVGHEFNTTIGSASATVRLPQPFVESELQASGYAGYFGGGGREVNVAFLEPGSVRFEVEGSLEPLQGLTVAVGWPKGAVAEPTFWDKLGRLLADNFILLVPVVAFVWLLRRYRTRGVDPEGKASIVVRYEPPPGATAGEVGTVVDEKVDLRDITATLVDLAVRGHLEISIVEEKALLGLIDTEEIVFVRQRDASEANLLEHEKLVLEGVFASSDRVELSDLKQKFYKHIPKIKAALQHRMVEQGWFSGRADTIRQRFGLSGLLLGFLVFFGGMLWVNLRGGAMPYGLIVPVLAGGATTILFLSFAPAMPQRTRKGVDLRSWALGFEEFVERVEAEKLEVDRRRNVFEALLPYAMALGVAAAWARRFEGIYAQDGPRWFVGRHPIAGLSTTKLESSLSSAMTKTASVMTSAPRSSGSSGSGGGGSSGGGGGGGGGGSW